MLWTTALFALVPVLSQTAAARRVPQSVITAGGQDFATWQDYVNSSLFRELGLRCGTRSNPLQEGFQLQSDCSSSSTTIRPEYAPLGNDLYRIPVVVHILQSTSGQGQISDAMVASQIDVLNEDFLAIAGSLGGAGNNARIQFFLATEEPDGDPTTGITRSTNNTWFADSGSYYNSLAWDTTRYLNIYTNNAGGNLGYVPSLPSNGIVGSISDRVVILWSAFGRNAPIGFPYDLGRTATHEVGHYLGLYHTFDFGCGSASACFTTGDRICDTNQESSPVFGCPRSHISCGSDDPFDNYMDYSDDECYTQFTPQQVNRMRCTLLNWRVALPQIPDRSSKTKHRTAGLNLNGLSAAVLQPAGTYQLSITAPGYSSATIHVHAAPAQKHLSRGMVQLVDEGSTQFLVLRVGLQDGRGSVELEPPLDTTLWRGTAHAQAVLMGRDGWALTNALEIPAPF